MVQVDPEAGIERAAEHVRLLLVEHFGPGQPAAEHLEGRLGVDAVGLEEDERLGEHLDVGADDQLVGRLDRLAGATRSDMHDGLADYVEDRLRRSEVFGVAADHDRERRVLRSGLAAGDRRVEEPEPFLGGDLGELRGHVGADAREVDDERARRRRREHPVVSGEDSLHVGRVGDHDGHHLSAVDGVGDRGGLTSAGFDQRCGLAGRLVVARDLMPGVL